MKIGGIDRDPALRSFDLSACQSCFTVQLYVATLIKVISTNFYIGFDAAVMTIFSASYITHRLRIKIKTDCIIFLTYCFYWRPQRDSNSCYRRERAMS